EGAHRPAARTRGRHPSSSRAPTRTPARSVASGTPPTSANAHLLAPDRGHDWRNHRVDVGTRVTLGHTAVAPCEVPGSLPQTTSAIYRTFKATTNPQTTSEMTDAATTATIVRFFSFISETTSKTSPESQPLPFMHTRSRSSKGARGFRHLFSIA